MFLFQAEDGIRDLVRSRGLGDVYKRQGGIVLEGRLLLFMRPREGDPGLDRLDTMTVGAFLCLLYTSDAADERSSVDLGGRRIIKKKKQHRQMKRPDIRGNTMRRLYEGMKQ